MYCSKTSKRQGKCTRWMIMEFEVIRRKELALRANNHPDCQTKLVEPNEIHLQINPAKMKKSPDSGPIMSSKTKTGFGFSSPKIPSWSAMRPR